MSWPALLAMCLLGSNPVSTPWFAPLDVGVDSLSVPLVSDLQAELWPLELSVSITPRKDSEHAPLPEETIVVSTGQPVRLAASVLTPQGRHVFSITVAARAHPGDVVELEWDLEVLRAPFVLPPGWDSWRRYLLHRVDLAPPPEMGALQVTVVRSDITPVRSTPHREFLEIDGVPYEIRLSARQLRG